MPQLRRETLTWDDVDKLIEHLLPQFQGEFETMVIITRGGILPGGMLAEATCIPNILTAAVDFPAEAERQRTGLFAWPRFIQFPNDELINSKRCLVVDDVWGSGRTITVDVHNWTNTGLLRAENGGTLALNGAMDMAMMVTDRAVQVLGGHGYIREHPVERWMRNGRGIAMLNGLVIV